MRKSIILGIIAAVFLCGFAHAETTTLKFAIMDPAQAAPVKYAYQPWAVLAEIQVCSSSL